MKKNLLISSDDVQQFNQLVHYSGTAFATSYFLTLWRQFSVEELKDLTHLLVEQQIHYKRKIQLDAYYQVSLEKTASVDKGDIAFWTYELSITKGDLCYVKCLSKIYIKKNCIV